MPFAATRVYLEIVILSEVRQKIRQLSYDIACMKNLEKNNINELISKTETGSQTEEKLWLPKGKEEERNQKFRMSRYTLLYIKYATNKGPSVQHR